MPDPSSSPIDFDARCLHCGYRLRGLPGDPVRCPECFHANPRSDLTRRFSHAARLNQLRGAGDAFILALIAFAGGIWVWTLRGPMPVALPVLALAAVLATQALAVCRRIMPEHAEWQPLFYRYVTWTCTLILVPVGIWAMFAVLIWRITTSFSAIRAGAGVDAVDIAAAMAPTALVLYFVRPLRRLRWKQRRAFARLARLIRKSA